MTDETLIRKAVELADGWTLEHDDIYFDAPENNVDALCEIANPPQFMLDALAAQLARQFLEQHPDNSISYDADVLETLKRLVHALSN